MKVDTAKEWLVDYLGVTMEEATAEIALTNSANVRTKWLGHEVYPDRCREGQWDMAARAYLLHLVGSTLFADKSGTRTKVAYLSMFVDLGDVGSYSWGGMALAYMYDQLREASKAMTKQMAGYLTLLQVYFYSINTDKCLVYYEYLTN